MSLLMDALRKAEESRKKAESGPVPEQGKGAVGGRQNQAPHTEHKPAAGSEQAKSPVSTQADNSVVPDSVVESETQSSLSESRKTPGSSGIPDLPLDFQDSEAPQKDQPARQPTADKSSPASDSVLELAPQESTATRQPFTGTADEPHATQPEQQEPSAYREPSADKQPSAHKEPSADQEPSAHKEPSADKEPSAHKEPSEEKEPPANEYPASDSNSASTATATGEQLTTAGEPEIGLELSVDKQIPQGSETRSASQADARQPDAKPVELTLAAKPPGIRERSASSRASARSVFAAKQQGSGKRRRQLLALATAAAVVLLVAAGGLLMMLGNDSGSGITVPDNYVAGQSQNDFLEQDDAQQDLSGSTNFAEADVNDSDQQTSLTAADSNTTVRFTTLETLPAETALPSSLPPVAEPQPDAVPEVQTQAATTSLAEAEAADNSGIEVQASVAAVPAESAEATATAADTSEPEAVTSSEPQSSPVSEAPATVVAQISFSRRQADSSLQPLLTEAYSAYQQGNLELARQRYQAALADSPMHRDALLGLAAIAVAQQQPAQAMDYYSQMLARNPADPVARAALLELSPAGGPATQERELRRLLDLHPQVASLAYAMGNFYASRQQWSDAQQYYFRALQLARSQAEGPAQINPDYAYNLAVSLEHLNQVRAAISFYQEALTQAQGHQAGFDLSGTRRRVESLSRTLTP